MENRLDILNELKDISPVIAGIGKLNVFTVPLGYFEYLSADIMTGIEIETDLQNNTTPASSSQNIPQGYFDSLAAAVLQKIKAQDAEDASGELRVLSPMLYSIQNENVFEVPKGYFDTLTDIILTHVNPQQTKVVAMHRRSSTFVKYAVAAAFTGVMALGVFKFTVGNKNSVDPIIAQGTQIAKENKFDEELAKITDTDIVKYLEANGSDVNAALVANSVDENELPGQLDYLMDEKALDNYLDNISVKDLSD